MLIQIYKSLPNLLPALNSDTTDGSKPKLSKKHSLLITSAVGELYFYSKYQQILDLIVQLRQDYDTLPEGDRKGRFPESLSRWEERCQERLASQSTDQANAISNV